MEGMSNNDIIHSLNSYSQFLGVFPSDINPINIIKSYPTCFIMNTNPKSISNGGHWLAFYLTSPTKLEFFDSLGLQLHYYISLFHYFSNFSHIMANKIPLQSTNSSICGDYCVSFLSFRMNHFSFNHIITIISKYQKCKSRDSFVRRIRFLFNDRKHK